MEAALAPGFQVVAHRDDLGMVDDEAGLLGHFADCRRFETFAKLEVATSDGPVGGMAALAFAEQHLSLGVDQDDADPDAGVRSGHWIPR